MRTLGLTAIGFVLFAGCGDDGGSASSDGAGSTSMATTAADSSTGEQASSGEGTTASVDDTSSEDSSSGGPIGGCWDDLPVGESETLYQGFTNGSEGIAFGADGLLYVTTIEGDDGTVWQLDADGTPTEYASIPTALGLAARSDGSFVVASFGQANSPDGAVYNLDPRGVATEIATGIDNPNFVTFTPNGDALVSDNSDTRIFQVDLDGTVTEVIADVPSPNGMAYGPNDDYFYVASTFSTEGQLTRYEVGKDGLPIEDTAIEIMHLGSGSTPDGIAIDADGYVYVAANLPGQIWRVDGSVDVLTEGELVAEGIDTAASLAFGQAPHFDPCSIYVTQLFADRVLRVSVGVEGTPLL